jgi:cell division protein FtsL
MRGIAINTMNQKLIQAYQQAPWRTQTQRIAFFLLGLITVALIAGLYLYVSAQTTDAGVKVQKLETTRENILRSNADLKIRLAKITTIEEMKTRAQKLGFEPVNPDKVTYMVIPGYSGRQIPNLSTTSEIRTLRRPIIKPSYTQSLWEWALQEMASLNKNNGGGKK